MPEPILSPKPTAFTKRIRVFPKRRNNNLKMRTRHDDRLGSRTMSFSRTFRVLASVALLTGSLIAAALTPAGASDGETDAGRGSAEALNRIEPTANQLLNWMLFREQLHMHIEVDDLEKLASLPNAEESIDLYGAPFTAAEQRELDKREDLAEEAAVLEERLISEEHPTYGGVYLDHSSGELIVQFTESLSASERRELMRNFRQDGSVRVERVKFSRIELDRAAAVLLSTPVDGALGVAVGRDPQNNSLNVTIETGRSNANPDAGGAGAIDTDFVRGRVAVPVNVSVRQAPTGESCPSRFDCRNPYRGGLIYAIDKGNGNASFCSTGFVATRNSTGENVMLTSGHCQTDLVGRPAELPFQVFIANNPNDQRDWVGPNGFGNGVDVSMFSLPASQSSNFIYRRATTDFGGATVDQKTWTITKRKTNGFIQNQIACHSSFQRGYRCGTVIDPYSTGNSIETGSGPTSTPVGVLVRLRIVTSDLVTCGSGDVTFGGAASGSPVTFRHRAYGLHSSCLTVSGNAYQPSHALDLYFTRIRDAELSMQATVRTS